MSNLDQKSKMLQTKLKLPQMKHGKSGHSALYLSLYLLRQKSD